MEQSGDSIVTDDSGSEIEEAYEVFSDEDCPPSPVKQEMETEKCSVCLETVKSSDMKLRCNHSYHRDCLRTLLAQHGNHCALCRQEMNFNWLYQNGIVTRMSHRDYWRKVRRSFGPWPHVGPFIPSHQRLYNKNIYGNEIPPAWTRLWIADKKAEMRMYLNLPPSLFLTNSLLMRFIARGRHGLPECTPQMLM